MRLVSSLFSPPCNILIKTRQPATSSRCGAGRNSTALYRLRSTSHISWGQPEPIPPPQSWPLLFWGLWLGDARGQEILLLCNKTLLKGKFLELFFFSPKSLTRRSVCVWPAAKIIPCLPKSNRNLLTSSHVLQGPSQSLETCTGCPMTM